MLHHAPPVEPGLAHGVGHHDQSRVGVKYPVIRESPELVEQRCDVNSARSMTQEPVDDVD